MKKPAYKIKNVDRLDPFLMSLTSSDNHWMFISSNGSLTAGREKADHALFPYITDNLIHTSLNTTGPKTKINIYKNNEKINTWSPLSYLPTKHKSFDSKKFNLKLIIKSEKLEIKYDNAILHYDRVLLQENHNMLALLNKGLAHHYIGQYETALECYCVENAGRSQMAEGFFKKLAPGQYGQSSI